MFQITPFSPFSICLPIHQLVSLLDTWYVLGAVLRGGKNDICVMLYSLQGIFTSVFLYDLHNNP